MSSVPSSRPDLSALSLDAAVQLDRMERHQAADTQVLVDFLKCLVAMDASSAASGALNLSSRPQNVEIFNWALHKADSEPAKDVSDLERRVTGLFLSMKDVSEGKKNDGFGELKAFCLSLHQALLNESSPFNNEDDWVLMGDERFA